jgi:hypothetical protein
VPLRFPACYIVLQHAPPCLVTLCCAVVCCALSCCVLPSGPKERGIRLFTVHVRRGPPDVQDPGWNSLSKLNCIAACIQVRWGSGVGVEGTCTLAGVMTCSQWTGRCG